MTVAIICGTALGELDRDSEPAATSAETPYGAASALPRRAPRFGNALFLNRHGEEGRRFLPHEINYRANAWLLREVGADAIVAVFAVGGISLMFQDGDFVVPDQIIDYTWGREHTFSSGANLFHADFTAPFADDLRQGLVAAATKCGVSVRRKGVYGCTQGPRLETAAEIDRMEQDGCTVVGMTAMPEASLARELGIRYAGVCVVVNQAAGRGDDVIEVEDMRAVVRTARPPLLRLLAAFLDGA